VVLHEPASRVGVALMSLMAPSILFMLLGGAVADRADCRRLLVRGHFLVALLPLGLALVITGGRLSYGALIVYALGVGTVGAFVLPARDAMLTRVAAGNLGRAVAIMTATQFGSQLVGIASGAAAETVGAPALLLLQAGMLALGSWRHHAPARSRWRAPPSRPEPARRLLDDRRRRGARP